jgi:aminoglycoside phosphotransferase (APT) family kinase protein
MEDAAVGPHNMPAAEVEVSADLVRRLLADQHPDLAGRSVELIASGWDNLMFRLGADMIVRMPRRSAAARLVAHEQRWLPVLAPRLPLPIPVPARVGTPALGYPWNWSIVPLLPGQIAARRPPADPRAAAVSLGGFLGRLHQPAEPDAPENPYRGVPLADRSEADTANMTRLAGHIHGQALKRRAAALDASPWAGPPVWLHGDFHPANILVSDGQVSGVIDFGDLTSGDPATDLAVAWMLLPRSCHQDFRAGYASAGGPAIGTDDWLRAEGWALAFSLVFLAHSADNPLMATIGQRTLDTILGTSVQA